MNHLTIREIVIKGSFIAIIVTIPSLITFYVSWTILDDIIQAAVIGAIVHFVAMGFSLKISKKLSMRK